MTHTWRRDVRIEAGSLQLHCVPGRCKCRSPSGAQAGEAGCPRGWGCQAGQHVATPRWPRDWRPPRTATPRCHDLPRHREMARRSAGPQAGLKQNKTHSLISHYQSKCKRSYYEHAMLQGLELLSSGSAITILFTTTFILTQIEINK